MPSLRYVFLFRPTRSALRPVGPIRLMDDAATMSIQRRMINEFSPGPTMRVPAWRLYARHP